MGIIISHTIHIRTIHIPLILIGTIKTTMTEDMMNPDIMIATDIGSPRWVGTKILVMNI